MAQNRRGATAAAAGLIVAGVLSTPVVFVLFAGSGDQAGAACTTTATQTGDAASVGPGSLSREQLANASAIIEAGQALGLGARDQTIGIMTALGESGLRVLDHGDAAGPDSRGLFQQRANGAWGSLADRMDPRTSATNFFRALAQVPGRDVLAPTAVAHRVQRNADPFHYEPYWEQAGAIHAKLTETTAQDGTTAQPAGQAGGCGPTGVPASVNANGWALPNAGPVSSGYGYRPAPVQGLPDWHYGLDFADACGSPIHAVNDGVVVHGGGPYKGMSGNVIEIDHGDGMLSRYGHMFGNGVLVAEGDTVTGGEQIGRIGNAGNSTGCHLHFEITLNGKHVDPEAHLLQAGLRLN